MAYGLGWLQVLLVLGGGGERGALGLTQAGTSDAGNRSLPSLGAWRLPERVAQR